jgi:hypothetical protein
METRFTIRRGLQIKICLVPLSCSYGFGKGRSGIGLWMRASCRARRESHVPTGLAKQTGAIIMTGIMIAIIITVIVEMIIKKSLIIRLCKRLKRGRVRPKNDG